jgi:hypothetical protein
MGSLQVIDEALCLDQGLRSFVVYIGPALNGKAPSFEMHDETVFDRLKKLFFIKDYQVYQSNLDKRFFINNYPAQLYKLEDHIKTMIAALPAGSSLRSDGQIMTLTIQAPPNEALLHDALLIARAIYQSNQRKLSVFDRLPNTQRQPRPSWDQCPSPLFVIRELGVTIDVEVSYYSPSVFNTTNLYAFPKGILSMNDSGFCPYNEKAKPLLQELERRGGQELALALGKNTSLYSSMNDQHLRLALYSELNEVMVRSAVELLVRLATPKNDGPFR